MQVTQEVRSAIIPNPQHLAKVVELRRGKSISARKAGPGRMPKGRSSRPAGTKRIKRFIRDAKGEAISYRKDWSARTGLPANAV